MEIHELVTDSRSLLNAHYTNGDAFQCVRERWALVLQTPPSRLLSIPSKEVKTSGPAFCAPLWEPDPWVPYASAARRGGVRFSSVYREGMKPWTAHDSFRTSKSPRWPRGKLMQRMGHAHPYQGRSHTSQTTLNSFEGRNAHHTKRIYVFARGARQRGDEDPHDHKRREETADGGPITARRT